MTVHGSRVRLPRVAIGGVARSVVLVGAATAVGQGALILASPVLARMYDPEAFGLLSVYAAVLGVLLAVSSLRFDLAIPIATEDGEAVDLFLFCVLLALASSVVLGVALVVWGPQIATALRVGQVASLLWLLPVALFAASVAQGVASWAVYRRTFPALGRMRAIQGLTQAISQVVLGVLRVGPGGLIVGDVIGRIVGTEQLLRPFLASLRGMRLDASTMLRHVRTHWGFARVMTVASLFNALSLQIPFLLIPGLFDLDSSGQYFLAYRVLVLPASLVGAGVSQVFFGEASHRREDPQRLHDMALNVAVSLLVFAIPTYTIVMVAGPDLIRLLFGPQWVEAGGYAQIMAPGLILWSVASPISTLLLVGRRERESLAFTLAELLLKAGSLLAGAVLGSLVLGIAVLTAATILINIGALWRILRVAGASVLDLIRPGLRIAAVTLPSAVVVFLARELAPIGVVIVAGGAWALAFGLSARRSPELRALISGSHD
jgi:Membrane protein involved in the export of O-antigen and teichoic acid